MGWERVASTQAERQKECFFCLWALPLRVDEVKVNGARALFF
jgi:hypothetical protein